MSSGRPDVPASDERHVVEGVRRGDRTAIEALFRAHYAALVRFAASYTGSVEIAEEVVCDVFAALLDVGPEWHVRGSVRGYLFGAVRRRLLMRARTEHRERERYAALLAEDNPAVAGQPAETAEQRLIAREGDASRREALARALASLSQRQRAVVALRVGQGLDFAEIAEVMETTPAAVQMQLSRALRALRAIIPRDLLEP